MISSSDTRFDHNSDQTENTGNRGDRQTTEAKIGVMKGQFATTIVAAAENDTVHGGGERGAQFVADHA